MVLRLRLIPVTIVTATLMVGIKAGEVWYGASDLIASPAAAQAQKRGDAPVATGAPTSLKPPETGAGKTAAAESAKAVSSPPPTQPAESASARAPQPAEKAQPLPALQLTAAEAPAVAPPALPSRDPATFSPAELEVLQSLSQRRDVLEARVRDLELRESLLAAAERRVDERIAELKEIERRVTALLRQQGDEDEQNLKSLVKVYEVMKPKDAARIFERLEMEVLLDVVERMRENKLAPILADMDPARAKAITVELATRRHPLQREAARQG